MPWAVHGWWQNTCLYQILGHNPGLCHNGGKHARHLHGSHTSVLPIQAGDASPQWVPRNRSQQSHFSLYSKPVQMLLIITTIRTLFCCSQYGPSIYWFGHGCAKQNMLISNFWYTLVWEESWQCLMQWISNSASFCIQGMVKKAKSCRGTIQCLISLCNFPFQGAETLQSSGNSVFLKRIDVAWFGHNTQRLLPNFYLLCTCAYLNLKVV